MTIIRQRRVMLAAVAAAALGSCGGGGPEEQAPEPGEHRIPVTVTQVRHETVQVELKSVGRLHSRNVPVLAAEVNARVIAVLVEEGERVAKGQELVLLDRTTLELSRREAQADIERLKISIANEEKRVARYRDLRKQDMMPQERLDDAEAKLAADRAALLAAEARLGLAEDRLSKTRLLAPFSGVVDRRHVSVGDYARTGSPMITLVDTFKLRAILPFPETVGHRVSVGQPIFLESPIRPGQVVEARVTHIRPQVGKVNRSLEVVVDLDNPGGWNPDATVEARLVVEKHPDAAVIPYLALVERPAGMVVYRLQEPDDPHVSQVLVEPGVRTDGMVEIVKGLEAGDTIVVEGARLLTDGAAVEITGDSR